jgi:UDP-N-acetylmuramoyl-L-alanyl-D-glutamate--2,6-diaminopimelate ligase
MTGTPSHSADLAPLVAALEGARAFGDLEHVALGIAHDSRRVRPGCVFVALRGERADGHAFIAGAVATGARAIVVDEAYAREHPPVPDVATIVVPDTRLALSRLSAAFYGYPSRALSVVGVTGTNGKTTTTHLIATILEAAGIPCARIGTLGASLAGTNWPLDNTTPLALELQGLLAEMRERGAVAVAMEVSSHALALDRVADVDFRAGVLTNVTRDHLDFHGTFEAYAAAKRSLFDNPARASAHLSPARASAHLNPACAVLGIEDPYGRRWAQELPASGREVVTYGFAEDAQVRALDLAASAGGSWFRVDGRPFTLPLPGRFNVSNALAALAVARTFGIDDATSARALAACPPVPGRMEHFAGGGIDVLVDYAHTPDALDAVLRAAREAAPAKLVVVFGCGGDRDRGKRPQMGRVARSLADRVFVTSDNPRREDPGTIVAAVLEGIDDRHGVEVEPDRRRAIRRAIAEAGAGDVIVVAGKGHETYQIVGDQVFPFDDRDEVRAALAARPVRT